MVGCKLSLAFAISSLLLITVECEMGDNFSENLAIAFKRAEEEEGKEDRENQRLAKEGKDDKSLRNSNRQFLMFSDPKAEAQELARVAYVELKTLKNIADITQIPPYRIKANRVYLRAWRKKFDLYCKPFYTGPSCNASDLYRTANGTCNNLNNPMDGSIFCPQRRLIPPMYDDVIDAPRSRSVYGTPLPSPRLISNVIHAAGKKVVIDSSNTVMEMQWGQFLDHDIVQTPVLKGKMGAAFNCCGEFKDRPECFPIPIPKDDPFFKTDCMNFARSSPVPTHGCNPGHREQMNQVTSYIDGSAVYGSSLEEQMTLRTGEHGLLKTGPNNLPPPNDADKCMLNSTEDYCLRAGDSRVNVVPSLGMSHATFIREHNRIARELGALNPHWDDETIFQETRKIISAVLQHITYTEYLPTFLNDEVMTKYNLKSTPKGFNTVYNPKRKATTANSFAVAAFRFGHSQIPQYQARVSQDYKQMTKTPIEFTYHNPHMVEEDNGLGLEDIARWVASDTGLEADRFMEDGYRNLLFLDRQGNSFDLAAVNIQRGRDHGIAPYNHWRAYCGLPAAKTFDTKPGGLVDHDLEVAKLLKQVYSHPDDIDLFTGGLSERFIPGGSVGPTFACILGNQFRAYKEGDRFWYENRFTGTGFTEAQLNEIKKVRMSMVLCNNYQMDKIQTEVFKVAQGKNKLVDCADIPQIDLTQLNEIKKVRMSMVLCNKYQMDKIQTEVFKVAQGKNKLVDCADIPQIDLNKWEALDARDRPGLCLSIPNHFSDK